MDSCSLKIVLITSGLIIALIGLLFAIRREVKSISKGVNDVHEGGFDPKSLTFKFKMGMGVILIPIGLFCSIYTAINMPACDIQNKNEKSITTQKSETPSITETVTKANNPIQLTQPVEKPKIVIPIAPVLTVFDGEWFSGDFNYSFRIKNNIGIATKSNSYTYKVGDVMLRIMDLENNSYNATQIYTDGLFHPVKITFINTECISIFDGYRNWRMVKINN